MKLLTEVKAVRDAMRAVRSDGATIGLVPTMGALHDGHLSLASASVAHCDVTAVSIFVNPLQFGPNEDFERYPRDFEADAKRLEPLGVDYVFTMTPEDMYPSGYCTYVVQEGLFEPLCGEFRPGHFRGVATVVTKLFLLVQPHAAFFGQKDAQQCIVLKRLVDDLGFDVDVRVVPTMREPDGLAMSSRNLYLSESRRRDAASLYRALSAARSLYEAGERSTAPMIAAMDEVFAPIDDIVVEYREIVDPVTLQRIDRVESRALAAVAARLGPSRLIDNVVLGSDTLW